MFALSSLAVLLSAASSLAIPSHEIRNIHHNDIVKRANVTLSKRFSANRVTWYPTNTGPDACTGKNHGDYDNIVALNIPQWGNLNARSQHCGKKIRISANGKSAIGVIQDACGTCYESGQIDLTKGLFEKFTTLDKGVFTATWEFVDDDAGDDDDDKPAPPKPSKTPTAPSKKPTPPPKSTPKPSPTPDKDEDEKPETPVKKPTSTKKPEAKPTPTPEPEPEHLADDNSDDDEECEEYEDDDDDTVEANQHEEGNTHEEKPVKPPTPTPTPSPTPVKAPVKAPVKVIETPKAVVPPPVVSSTSSTVANLAPTPPVAPAADPSPSSSTDDVSGGISQSSLGGNGALSLSGNKALMSAVAIALLSIQLL